MVLTNKTIEVLRNFSGISKGLIFNDKDRNKEGHKGYLSVRDNVITAFYELEESEKQIPRFAIYDLNDFLSVVDEFKTEKDFDIEFKDVFLILKSKTSQAKFMYPSQAVQELMEAQAAPLRKENFFDDKIKNVQFTFSKDDFLKLRKMSGALKYDYLFFEIKGDVVVGVVRDLKNPTSNNFKKILGKNILANGFTGSFAFQMSDMKVIDSCDYEVLLFNESIAYLRADQKAFGRLEYFLGKIIQ